MCRIWLYNSRICMSGIYMGYRKEKKSQAAPGEGYRSCMLGWSKEMGRGNHCWEERILVCYNERR